MQELEHYVFENNIMSTKLKTVNPIAQELTAMRADGYWPEKVLQPKILKSYIHLF